MIVHIFYILQHFFKKSIFQKIHQLADLILSEKSLDKAMLLTIFFYPKNLENSEDTDHDKTILISVMTIHEFSNLATKVYDEDEKDKYRHHESLSILTYPVREGTMIRFEIFCLQHCESSYYEYE